MNPRAAEGWGTERRGEGKGREAGRHNRQRRGIPRQMNRLENGIVKVREYTELRISLVHGLVKFVAAVAYHFCLN